MFSLISPTRKKEILEIAGKVENASAPEAAENFFKIIENIRSDIPDKKRISYGRYSIIKNIGEFIYPALLEKGVDIQNLSLKMFENPGHDPFVRSLGVQVLSIYAKEHKKLNEALEVFEKAACDRQWEVRECSAGFIRKLIKNYPDEMKEWYLKMVKSESPMKRRFASESLRPVADNKWLKNNPKFVFSIIKHLYKEPQAYPRTSVGNSLSDWMRIDEKETLKIVKKLAESKNKNSYWIAYRACRNLVKKKPLLVMDLLNTDEYIYKDRKFYRGDYW